MSPALRRMGEACAAARCLAVLTGGMTLSTPWVLTKNMGVWSTSLSVINGQAGAPPAVALDLQPGDYSGTLPYLLPAVTNVGTAIQVRLLRRALDA